MKRAQPFGPYELIERINVGGMAEVFRARHRSSGHIVAIKRILPSVAEDDDFISMFRDEAAVASRLDHPNIAKILDVGQHDGSYFIALEYVVGRDMRTIFDSCARRQGPMPIELALYVILNLCQGLDYAHQCKDANGKSLGLVHRDVSPQNILVSMGGEVKLIDFGIAKSSGKLARTQAGSIKGKFGYMSPEQVRGLPVDRRSDIFSMGICLWEFLTLQRLFHGDNEIIVMERIRNAFVPRPRDLVPSIPEPVERILMRALAKDPDERFASASEFHAELSAFARAAGLIAPREQAAAFMKRVFGDTTQGTSSSREEAHVMSENKGGSDLDVFEGLARKPQARPVNPPPSVPVPLTTPSRGGPPAPKARTLLGMAPPVPPPRAPMPSGARIPPPLPSSPNLGTAPGLPPPLPSSPGLPPPHPSSPAIPQPSSPALPVPSTPPAASASRAPGVLPPVVPPPRSVPPVVPPPRTNADAPAEAAPAEPAAATSAPAAAAAEEPAKPAAVEMDWDDEDEKTHVYDKQSSEEVAQAVMRPLPAAGTPAPPSASAAAALLARSGNVAAPISKPPPSLQPGQAPGPQPSQPDIAQAVPSVPQASVPTTVLPAAKAPSKTPMLAVAVVAIVAVAAAAFLMLRPTTGTLKVYAAGPQNRSVPGVRVFVGGKKVCDTVPCTVENLSAGLHDVTAEADGYLPAAPKGVEVLAGKQVKVDLQLAVATAGTGLRVTGGHDGIKLIVDDKDIGPLPQTLKDLAPGEHKVRFDGGERYKSVEKTVVITPDRIEDLGEIKLEVLKGRANFELVTTGAQMYLVPSVGDKRQLDERMFSGGKLGVDIDTSKKWRLQASKAGYEDLDLAIEFEVGKAERQFRIELQEKGKPAPVADNDKPTTTPTKPATTGEAAAKPATTQAKTGPGILNINSIPPSAVLVDGRPMGRTPKSGVSVTPGTHTITFIHPEKGRKSTSVTVGPGETKGVGVRF